jgi:prophage DNA circulation protein
MLEQTLPASFGGVGFLVKSTSTVGGLKHAKHVYPNSSNQKIEGLGPMQLSDSLTGFVANEFLKDDYKEKRDALIAKLNSGERLTLVHPLRGSINNVKCVAWNLDEDFATLGVATFTMSFEVDLDESTPQVSTNSALQVFADGDSCVAQYADDMDEGFITSFTSNVTEAVEGVESLVKDFEEATAIFTIAADQVDAFSNQLSTLATDIVGAVLKPLELANSITGLFDTVSGMYVTFDAAFEVLTQFFGFGDDEDDGFVPPTNTAIRVEREKNRNLLRETVQANALTYAMNVASKIEFETVGAQEEIVAKLEEQFDKIVATKNITDLTGVIEQVGLSTESKSLLADQRQSMQSLFDDNRISLGQLIEIKTPLTSSRLLAYQYYGSSVLGEEIAGLNDINDSSFVSGELEIITR